MAVTRRTLELEQDLRNQLEQMTDAQTRALVSAWVDAWDEIAPDLTAALLDMLVVGDKVTRAQLLRSNRLRRALAVVADSLDTLARDAGVLIAGDLRQVIDTAGAAQASILDSQLPPNFMSPQFLDAWSRVDERQITAIVTRSTQQITSLTRPLSAEAYDVVRRELIRGVAAGSNPRETARRMVARAEHGFNGGLTRALTISRTETLDAHRAAAELGQAQHLDVVAGWTWLASLTPRTCRSCLGMHGREFGPEVPGPEDHQQGRCSRMPRTKSWAELGIADVEEPPDLTPDADAFFKSLTPAEQEALLGRKGFRAWLAGEFPREQWSKRRRSEGWRDAQVPANPGDPDGGDGAPPTPPGSSQRTGDDEPERHLGDTLDLKFVGNDTKVIVQRALASIAKVHGVDRDMPTLPVLEFSEEMGSEGQRLGSYSFELGASSTQGPTDSYGRSVAISINLLDERPEVTFLHELGHFLDHKGLGDLEHFASANDSSFAAWRAAVAASPTYQLLQTMADHDPDRDGDWLTATNAAGVERTWNPPRELVGDYFMDWREVFARAYAQWIALRSETAGLAGDVKASSSMRELPAGWTLVSGNSNFGIPSQWGDDEFEPIAAALDVLFVTLGLRRNQS